MPLTTRQVPGFPGYYVANNGSLWSKWKTRRRASGGRGVESFISDKMKRMKSGDGDSGYRRVGLRKDGKYHYFLLHRLVLLTFVGPPPSEDHECCHRDGDETNNRSSNLYWGTRKQNMEDMIRHDRTTRGERDSQAKLTEEDVLEIVQLLNARVLFKKIAERFGVSSGAIGCISRGTTWSHLTKGILVKQVQTHWSSKPDSSRVSEKAASKNRGKKHTPKHCAQISATLRETWAKRKTEYQEAQP